MVSQLRYALGTLQHHVVQQPVSRDLVPHAENVSAWIALTCGYPLVEQALKAALNASGLPQAVHRGTSGHDLGYLYSALLPVDKDVVKRVFAGLARKLPGMPWRDASDFLESIGQDYESWRYLLIELPPRPLSATHPEALLVVAEALVRILEDKSGDAHPASTDVMPNQPPLSEDKGEQRQWREDGDLVLGLDLAEMSLRRHIASNLPTPGPYNLQEQDSASAWMSIICGYSLLEQALKALLKKRNHRMAEQTGAAGHHLDRLFKALSRDTTVLEQGFGAYASLLGNVHASSASDFLRRVGRRYNVWRYLLVEQPTQGLADIHPGALLEVAFLVINILRNETFTDHGLSHVGNRLVDDIVHEGINPALEDRALTAPGRGDSASKIGVMVNSWIHQSPNLLTAFAAHLAGVKMPKSDLATDILARAERHLDQFALSDDGMDLRVFLKRARSAEHPLAWDGSAKTFIVGG